MSGEIKLVLKHHKGETVLLDTPGCRGANGRASYWENMSRAMEPPHPLTRLTLTQS